MAALSWEREWFHCASVTKTIPHAHTLHRCPVVLMSRHWQYGDFSQSLLRNTGWKLARMNRVSGNLGWTCVISSMQLCRKLYSSIQVIILYQHAAALQSNFYTRGPTTLFLSASTIHPKAFWLVLCNMDVLWTPDQLRVLGHWAEQHHDDELLKMQGFSSIDKILLGLHEKYFPKSLCRVFPKPFNNGGRKGNKNQTKSP